MQTIDWSLDELLKGLVTLQENYSTISISGLSIDSRLTATGDLFIALQGIQQHGLQHSQEAINNGAMAIAWESSKEITQRDLPTAVPCIEISDLHSKLGLISQRFYQNISKHMHITAVTGTDGKTSVSQFIAQALQKLNMPCGVIGTLGYGVYPDYEAATHTTPDAIRTHALLYDYHLAGAKHAVIEASSHGLSQGRLKGVEINTAVFTNLGRDHMDYHDSIEDYGNAKRLLFQSEKLQNAVINIDDDFGSLLAKEFLDQLNVITYSIKANSSISASNIEVDTDGTHFEVQSSWGNANITTKLVGNFNVSNLLAVLGVLLAQGTAFDEAVRVLESVQTVPGRMQFISADPAVVIDYAHTPQALANVLKVLGGHCVGELWCVFGCGGDRDQGKRKLMAEAVEEHADVAVLTDDNPRFEDPDAITNEVASGFSGSYSYTLLHDRREAIHYAIKNAKQQDLVLIAGKGHEAVQIIQGKQLLFDDKKVATEVLKEIS